MKITKKLAVLLGVIFFVAAWPLWAQEDETPAQKAYREDYDQFQKIAAIKDPLSRADEYLKFLKERPKSQIENYVLQNYLQILGELNTQQKWDTMGQKAENLVRVRPKVGETYYFLGFSLRQQNKIPEAMDALAKCYVLRCPVSEKARQFLESLYKGSHSGKTTGLEDVIQKARKDIGD